jgi:hypothetical protein
VEGEVLSLDSPISKAFSVATFVGLTLAPIDGPRGVGARGGDPAPHDALATSLGPTAAHESEASKAKTEPPAAPASSPTGVQGPCASGMLLVEGDYCPDADQVCLKWLDPPPYQNLRCGEYAKPAKCKVPRQHRRFCVDSEEYAESVAGTDA